MYNSNNKSNAVVCLSFLIVEPKHKTQSTRGLPVRQAHALLLSAEIHHVNVLITRSK